MINSAASLFTFCYSYYIQEGAEIRKKLLNVLDSRKNLKYIIQYITTYPHIEINLFMLIRVVRANLNSNIAGRKTKTVSLNRLHRAEWNCRVGDDSL